MINFLKNLLRISDKNPPEELGEVETQDDSNVKIVWHGDSLRYTKFTKGSDNVFRDIGCDNPEELLEEAEARIVNADLYNAITEAEAVERKDFARLKELFENPSVVEHLPEITLKHLSKRQLTGILGSTEDALKETKDKFEKADLKFTIKAIKVILKGRVKNGI